MSVKVACSQSICSHANGANGDWHDSKLSELLARYNKAINLFKLIVNPNSFAQSVENLFYVSFLVRTGDVSIELTDMDIPEVG